MQAMQLQRCWLRSSRLFARARACAAGCKDEDGGCYVRRGTSNCARNVCRCCMGRRSVAACKGGCSSGARWSEGLRIAPIYTLTNDLPLISVTWVCTWITAASADLDHPKRIKLAQTPTGRHLSPAPPLSCTQHEQTQATGAPVSLW